MNPILAALPWGVGLGGMALFSLRLREAVPAEAQLAMQFGLDGQPTWRARRDIAIWTAPAIGLAMAAVCIAALSAPPGPHTHLPGGGGNWLVALLPPSILLAVHVWWLRRAVAIWRGEQEAA